jgi:hypothetical protein
MCVQQLKTAKIWVVQCILGKLKSQLYFKSSTENKKMGTMISIERDNGETKIKKI